MKKRLINLPLEGKIKKSKKVIKKALEEYPNDKIALAWTGGKDSTLVLWLTKEVCRENGFPLPKIVFINEGSVFRQVMSFVRKWSRRWGIKVDFVRNNDIFDQVKGKIGSAVTVKKLSKRNQKELKRLGFKGRQFPFEPESFIGNHLMKTVAMNIWLEENDIQAFITGIRWDEQEARAKEKYFSPRKDPDHVRIHPNLHFREKDIWEANFKLKIPFVKLYKDGYRSLGAKASTEKPAKIPAWEQDLDKTTERVGRRQDKEKIMARLRKLGYM
jgi:phosphoadenosine phosphosulfate reductase